MAAAGDAARCPEIPGRCHHCAGPLSKDMVWQLPLQIVRLHFFCDPAAIRRVAETSSWTVPAMVRDSFSMVLFTHFIFWQIGSAVGGIAGAFYGFNHTMPFVRRYIKGPMWMHFLVGAPPVIVFSSACAGLAGGTIPAAAQLVSSSYHASMSSSSLARSSSHATMPSQSFARSASHDNMHKARSSSPL
ncbi:hypothetical protein HU200_056984 [Digitaria exilis]|uniref:Uncharacterized protein n=1 Tax=Digitaria exilis TaxID=1010633 RepID=A0A835E1W9_9POAL|nr:hypothetical protein HU200_056984 [Digitaria exilis]